MGNYFARNCKGLGGHAWNFDFFTAQKPDYLNIQSLLHDRLKGDL